MSKIYKVYLLERSNHVVAVHFLIVDDDEAAVEAARQLPDLEDREVWCGERRVAIIELSLPPEVKASL